MTIHKDDKQFVSIVEDIVDQVHEPKTYAWVNEKALEAYNVALGRKDTFDTLNEDATYYQIFVSYQCMYLRDVVIEVLNRF